MSDYGFKLDKTDWLDGRGLSGRRLTLPRPGGSIASVVAPHAPKVQRILDKIQIWWRALGIAAEFGTGDAKAGEAAMTDALPYVLALTVAGMALPVIAGAV